jgi:hypothetical protein
VLGKGALPHRGKDAAPGAPATAMSPFSSLVSGRFRGPLLPFPGRRTARILRERGILGGMTLPGKDGAATSASTEDYLAHLPTAAPPDAPAVDPDATQISLVNADLSRPLGGQGPRYARGELLGMGGMGEVWLQRDARIGRQVAFKTLRGGGAADRFLGRFLREARVQGQLEHPSVVPVYDLGIDEEGRPFFTMKRVRGETLTDILGGLRRGDDELQKRFSQRRLLADLARICLAIEYAHASGVVHRDLKPSNLMFGQFGETYVLDWGIAKLSRGADIEEIREERGSVDLRETREGELLGTPLYMAPEQLHGHASSVDGRADVYALGAILFEILTREPLRKGSTLPQLFEAAARHERPSSRVPVPPELDELCARAVHPDPAQRLPSAKALADGLERYLEGERDLSARQDQAQRLLQEARACLARPDIVASARVEAMRAALKALALVPEDTEAQRILLSLLLDSGGTLPPEAEEEFAESDVRIREQGARLGIWAYLSWLAPLGLSLWVGVLDWTMPLIQVVFVLLCIATSALVLRRGLRSRPLAFGLAVLSAVTVAGASCWLGPFVLVPAASVGSAVFFVIHSTQRERPWLIGTWTLASVAPFLVEFSGLVPPAYSFVNGDLVLHARSLRLPEGPTIAGLIYLSASFLVLLCIFVGRLRDRQRAAERSLFVQAWHLRQLFPAPRP